MLVCILVFRASLARFADAFDIFVDVQPVHTVTSKKSVVFPQSLDVPQATVQVYRVACSLAQQSVVFWRVHHLQWQVHPWKTNTASDRLVVLWCVQPIRDVRFPWVDSTLDFVSFPLAVKSVSVPESWWDRLEHDSCLLSRVLDHRLVNPVQYLGRSLDLVVCLELSARRVGTPRQSCTLGSSTTFVVVSGAACNGFALIVTICFWSVITVNDLPYKYVWYRWFPCTTASISRKYYYTSIGIPSAFSNRRRSVCHLGSVLPRTLLWTVDFNGWLTRSNVIHQTGSLWYCFFQVINLLLVVTVPRPYCVFLGKTTHVIS